MDLTLVSSRNDGALRRASRETLELKLKQKCKHTSHAILQVYCYGTFHLCLFEVLCERRGTGESL